MYPVPHIQPIKKGARENTPAFCHGRAESFPALLTSRITLSVTVYFDYNHFNFNFHHDWHTGSRVTSLDWLHHHDHRGQQKPGPPLDELSRSSSKFPLRRSAPTPRLGQKPRILCASADFYAGTYLLVNLGVKVRRSRWSRGRIPGGRTAQWRNGKWRGPLTMRHRVRMQLQSHFWARLVRRSSVGGIRYAENTRLRRKRTAFRKREDRSFTKHVATHFEKLPGFCMLTRTFTLARIFRYV